MADALATVAAMAVGLICLRVGRGPLDLLILALLHVQAGLHCGRLAIRASCETARQRYRECYERAVREAGR